MGPTTFKALVANITPLTSWTTDVFGPSSSVGVSPTGVRTFNENTQLAGTYNNSGFTAGGTTTLCCNVTINAGAGSVTFQGTVNAGTAGAAGLTAKSLGTLARNGFVGSTAALSGPTTRCPAP